MLSCYSFSHTHSHSPTRFLTVFHLACHSHTPYNTHCPPLLVTQSFSDQKWLSHTPRQQLPPRTDGCHRRCDNHLPMRTAVTYCVTCTVAKRTFVAGHRLEHYERCDEKGTPTYYRGTPNVSASAVERHFCGCKLQASRVSGQVVCSERVLNRQTNGCRRSMGELVRHRE